MPTAVGIIKESTVHLKLFVSFFIVIRVVEQGQCIREKSMVLTAVIQVQPFADSNALSSAYPVMLLRVPLAVYAIIIMGITISFAGIPSIKAKSIIPSSPRSLAKGSRNSEKRASRVMPPTVVFAKIHITSPAGAATLAALPSTKRVLSRTDRISIFPMQGLR